MNMTWTVDKFICSSRWQPFREPSFPLSYVLSLSPSRVSGEVVVFHVFNIHDYYKEVKRA